MHTTIKKFYNRKFPRIYLEYFSLTLLVLIIYFLSLDGSNIEKLGLLAAIGLGAQKLLPLINKIYNSFVNIKSNQPIILDILNYIEMSQKELNNNVAQNQKKLSFKMRLNSKTYILLIKMQK